MKLILRRIFKADTYTIGRLSINNTYFCDTIEDKDRGLVSTMPLNKITKIKVMHQTAIPSGIYNINMETVSPKFSKYSFYMEVCNGMLPRLENVSGFTGILIHVADGKNGADLLSGCIGIGKNIIKGGVTQGKEYFRLLYAQLQKAYKNHEKITIEIL